MKTLLTVFVLAVLVVPTQAQWPTSSGGSAVNAQEISDTAQAVYNRNYTSDAIGVNLVAGRGVYAVDLDTLSNYGLSTTWQVDSTLQIVGQRVYLSGPLERAITIDSIFTIGGPSAINVTATFYFNDTLWAEVAATKIITSPAASTSTTVGAWQLPNNANIAADNFTWLTYTAVTTKSNKHLIKFRYKFQ